MTLQIIQKQLDRVVLFTIDVRLVSGSKRARSEDIEQAKGVVLQQDEVLTLGSKKVFDPERLAIFRRLRSAMHRHCRQYGAAFLSGYAVPDIRADLVAGRLQQTVRRAQEELQSLLTNYQELLEQYCASRPTWAPTIRANAYSEDYLRSRISFAFNAVRVAAARDDGVAADNLQREIGGLMGSVLADVAADAADLRRDSLEGRQSGTRKVLRPLQAARDKLAGFAFLDRRLDVLAQMIGEVIASMPPEGPLRGTSLAMLHGMCSILATPVQALALAGDYETRGREVLIASLQPCAPALDPGTAAGQAHSEGESPPAGPTRPLLQRFGSLNGPRAPQATGAAQGAAAGPLAAGAHPALPGGFLAQQRRPGPRFAALAGARP